ncbi:20 kDa chaperonin, chloroplastic-like protein [Tanacetum coccineum]|uniref:20 kDa chaperonin, chloroplastic-like protein n=1 Tax=Tanacetum coccineum TaxID=301880 RepID=A0ABQ4XIN9_9ASTR
MAATTGLVAPPSQWKWCHPLAERSKVHYIEAVGTIGLKWVEVDVNTDTPVVYSKYAGTEVEFNVAKHLLLKEDDIVGILETRHVKDLNPLNQGLCP